MVGSARLLLVGGAALSALILPGVANAAPGELAPGTPLVGVCAIAPGASKDVTTVYPSGGLWAPYSIYGQRSELLGRLAPYEVTISGVGLKSRHFVPGVTYTKPGKAPSNLIDCTFDGTTPDGPVHVEVSGVPR